jgi:hypothetical protein
MSPQVSFMGLPVDDPAEHERLLKAAADAPVYPRFNPGQCFVKGELPDPVFGMDLGKPSQLDRIEGLLRKLAAEPVGTLGRYVVERKGSIYLAEEV